MMAPEGMTVVLSTLNYPCYYFYFPQIRHIFSSMSREGQLASALVKLTPRENLANIPYVPGKQNIGYFNKHCKKTLEQEKALYFYINSVGSQRR